MAAARRGVVVAGDGLSHADADAVVDFAGRAGWPVVAEPHSNARRPPGGIRCADALLRHEGFTTQHHPDLAVVVGRVGLSRVLLGWLSEVEHVGLDPAGGWWDPTRTSRGRYRCDPAALAAVGVTAAEPGWRRAWVAAAAAAGAAADGVLDESGELTEPLVARDVAASVPDGGALVVASSMPIRDLDLTMVPRDGLRVVANRGVSGIDGFVSTAMGVAWTHPGPTVALAGDLSLLHDATGLAADPPPDLTLVVVNNDGGGIFSLLPQVGEVDGPVFERLFGTPHGVDLAHLAAAYGVPHRLVTSPGELREAVEAPPAGVRVVEVRTDRRENAALHERMRRAAAAGVG